MKRRIAVLLALCLTLSLLPVRAWAAEEKPGGGWGGNLTWTYDEDTGTLTICGEGEMDAVPDGVAAIKENVKHVVIEEGVTTMDDSAFSGWPALESVALPQSLTEIGNSAFSGCDSLETVTYSGPQWKWDHYNLGSAFDPDEVTVNYLLSGGTCGEGLVWTYDSKANLLTIECDPGAGIDADFMVKAPNDSDTWQAALDNKCDILVSGDVKGVGEDDLSGRVIHFLGDAEQFEHPEDGYIHKLTEQEKAPPATCMETGLTKGFVCQEKDCDGVKALSPQVIPAIGAHTWGDWNTTKEPTETEKGTRTHTCSVCGATEEEDIPATGNTVTFKGNGGKPEEQIRALNTNGTLKALPEEPKWDKHTFTGWFTKESGGDQLDLNDPYTTFKPDTKIYAQWTEKTDTETGGGSVTFYGNGGEPKEQTCALDTDGKLKEQPKEPIWPWYIFTGWFTEESGGDQVDLNDPYATFKRDTEIYAHWTSDDSGNVPYIDPVIVTFNANGGSGGTTMTTGTDGKLSALPKNPVRSGYTFDGWYFGAPDDHLMIYTSTVFRVNTTVYAHWTQNSSGSTNPGNPSNPSNPSSPSNPSNPSTPSGGTYVIGTPGSVSGGSYNVSHASAPAGTLVTIQTSPWSNYTLGRLSVTRTDTGASVYVSGYGNGLYAFTMPASDVRLGVTFNLSYTGGYVPTQPTAATRYVDWYYSGGSIYHTTSGLVSANSVLTRDMFIAVLYNLDGSGDGAGDPTIWAVTNNIVPDVITSELWGPDRSITREQAAMILYCYAQYKGYNTSRTMSLSGYRDVGQIRAAAVPAMSWCCAAGLMAGTTSNTLSPLGSLTSGQAGTIITRLLSGAGR